MNYVITRFAPSPTGNLHIGGVRTALINYVVTQKIKKKFPKSKFLLRIEDTDKKRSNDLFVDNIVNGLKWLGINHDDKVYFQSQNIKRHQEIAYELIKKNKAFKCICSTELLEKKRNENLKKNLSIKRLCDTCEKDPKIQSLKKNYVVRIKIPNNLTTSINDLVQGTVKIKNKEIDNFILLRRDSSPTYMLSVVVDDFDMNINLIIRGDDHLNNAFRQYYIYKNLNWPVPQYAHLPLINGEDGKKLSKRHGSIDIYEFRKKGYLPEGIINNLILLGWAPLDKSEIIEINKIIDIYDLNKISKSASIFNYDKLNYFNNHFIKKHDNFEKIFSYCENNIILKGYIDADKEKFKRLFLILKKNLKYYKELEEICEIYFNQKYKTKKNKLLNDNFNKLINNFILSIENISKWDNENLELIVKNFIKNNNIKFIIFGKPLRLLLTNLEKGPSINEILLILGKKDSIQRIKNYINKL